MSRRYAGSAGRRAVAVAILVAAAMAIWSCGTGAGACDICGRPECTALTFRVEYADGGRQEACCPRCASHAVAEAGGRPVAALIARDFATGAEIDARLATYVDGSDVEHCGAPKEQRIQPGAVRSLAYDRCLPSLIAFRTREDAEAFSRDHGGTLRTFDSLGFGRN